MTDDRGKLIWDFYNLLIPAVDNKILTPQKAGKILAQLFDFRTEAWRVLGITEKALLGFEIQDFQRRPVGPPRLERAHLHHRRNTFRILFDPTKERSLFRNFGELDSWWKRRDITILCLADENAMIGDAILNGGYSEGSGPHCYPIQNEGGRHFANQPVACAFRPQFEGVYLRKLRERITKGEATLVDVNSLSPNSRTE